jgi:predicted nucleic acid-binding protein
VPLYTVTFPGVDIPRTGAVLDTNVLFARFIDRDDAHEQASDFLENGDYFPIVLSAVVIETWGMIVGSRNNWRAGEEFLDWLANPGHVMLVSHNNAILDEARELTKRLKIDIVDAALACFVRDVSRQCMFSPTIPIVTLDTKDFLKCMMEERPRLSILDLRSLELI